MSHEYRNQQDEKNTEIINQLLDQMPVFAEDYYDHLISRGRSTNTIKSYLYEFGVFLRFVATIVKKESPHELDISDLDRINQRQIEKYVARAENGSALAETAMRRKLSVVRSVYKYYLGIEAIKTNPTLQMEGARIKEKKVIKLNESQIKSLLDCIQNQSGVTDHSRAYAEKLVFRDLAIVVVLLGTGMRISELVGLNVSDFDLSDPAHPCFHIIRKGGDDDIVYCVPFVKESLEDYLIYTRPLLLSSDEENAMFLSTQKKRMGVNSIEKMMKKYCKAAGLPDNISPHKLRATFATTVYKQTKDIYAVRDSLHHKSIDTSKHYIADQEERKQSAAAAAGSMFGI